MARPIGIYEKATPKHFSWQERLEFAKEMDFDFAGAKHDLIIVQTGRGHADLSADYSSIPAEMKKVAEFFGKSTLSEVNEDEFYNNLSKIRAFAGDRAVLRSIHFFDENKRVDNEIKALDRKSVV